MSSGGVYALLKRVLGGKVGASVGLIFAFGLCCTAALYATAFATAVLDIDQEEDPSGRWKVVGLGWLSELLREITFFVFRLSGLTVSKQQEAT